jgi:hypothetical protein
MSQHFTSKKVLRWVEHGVKVEFKKGLPFAPKPSAPKFVDPQDVDFAIQDLLKGRHIGVYQDLDPGGDQFLSRSRVHTPPVKGKQRIVHVLCSLNDSTAKSQTTYEDLHMLKSVVRPQDWMLSLDVERVFFRVPIHPKHRKFFSSHLACRSLSRTSLSNCNQSSTFQPLQELNGLVILCVEVAPLKRISSVSRLLSSWLGAYGSLSLRCSSPSTSLCGRPLTFSSSSVTCFRASIFLKRHSFDKLHHLP